MTARVSFPLLPNQEAESFTATSEESNYVMFGSWTMAIAGLHNVSVLEPSILRDSQSHASRRIGNERRVNTRPSSLLQMWRELEDEHVVSRAQERISERLLQQRSDRLIDDISRADAAEGHSSEHTGDLDDESVAESECRLWSQGQIGSSNEHENCSNFSSEHSDFGEVERGRVRQVFREWMNCGVAECSSSVSNMSNNSRAEWLGETEQERVRIVREWVQINSQQRGASGDNSGEQPAEIGNQIERVRDGLVVNQTEGRSELTRRGIRKLCGRQALLDMLKKAERERQRELQELLEHQAVSHFAHRNRIQSLLRGRFLRNGRVIENERSTSMAENELGLLRQRHTVSGLRGDLGGNTILDIDSQESNVHVEGWQEEVPDNVVRDGHCSTIFDIVERSEGTGSNMIGNLEATTAVEQPLETSQNDAGEHSNMREVIDVSNESEPSGEESVICEQSGDTYNLQGNMVGDVQQWQDRVSENEEGDWEEPVVEYNDLRENVGRITVGDQQETAGYEWSQELLEGEDRENSHLEEVSEVWHEESGFQEAVHSWLEEPSDQDADPVRQIDTFYFPDDDNAHSTEIRELLSRRRVSNLLSSGFRQNLDRLIQSYVERQSHATIDWELDDTSPSPESAEQDLEQTGGYQNEGQVDSVESPSPSTALPSQQIPPSPLWDQESHPDNWPQHDMHQRFGIDWEIINDMRIDMGRLQQRMNNLQRMLEACMDMQLELQRSIRQEVSDALNRSSGSQGLCEDGLLEDGSKWDHVRKGICCICCDRSIDSLLYRCGHMCACSKCATELVESSGKCPMCRAPAVEVP
ncbi:Ring/U-Box superfamily protein [Prunus dulcis]|uniref:Ring/U-Box superfamily protein n=1 Tax=Prunus dulcis TaxID=3755 RepID=A0A4Y1RLB8_PRUDU|nr:Ring/U-Box superfamily protein [Prunus dulcis]